MPARILQSGLPTLAARLFVGGVFIYMGLNKVADPIAFLKLVRQYEMVPESPGIYLNGIALVLPWLEVLCGLALVLGSFVRGAALLVVAMLALFTPVIFLRAWHIYVFDGTPFLQIAFDCGCGTGVEVIWKKLVFNVVLLLAGLLPLFVASDRFSLVSWLPPRRDRSAGEVPGASPRAAASQGPGVTGVSREPAA